MPAPISSHKVLIVDDEIAGLQLLGELLREDANIISTGNGADAVAIAQSVRPDLILLNVDMPVVDGYMVCRQLKDDPRTKDIHVVFVISEDAEDDIAPGLELGAISYITKPLNPGLVKAKVKSLLGQLSGLPPVAEVLPSSRPRS